MITSLPTVFVLSPCLPFFFFFSSFLSCCSFGTDFNSPSDQFGIHKPLSTLLETLSPRDDEALQGMMITAAHYFLLQYMMVSAVTANEQGA